MWILLSIVIYFFILRRRISTRIIKEFRYDFCMYVFVLIIVSKTYGFVLGVLIYEKYISDAGFVIGIFILIFISPALLAIINTWYYQQYMDNGES
jgi:hypothetical protein